MTHQLRLVVNRPGLGAIAYRIGTHARFKRALLERIAGEPALRGLTTRSDDDFAIAMLDAWATAADVLTFYQERLANESYLRTATERLSLGHLARLLGYELGPGVAAGAPLVFTVDPVTSRGAPVPLPAGVKVQSIPGPDEPPQTFETAEPIDARVTYNELLPSRAGTVAGPRFAVTFEDDLDLAVFGPPDAPNPVFLLSLGPAPRRSLLRDYQAARVDGRVVVSWQGPEPPPDPVNVVVFDLASTLRALAGDEVTLDPLPPGYRLLQGRALWVLLADRAGADAFFTQGVTADPALLRALLPVEPGQRHPGEFAPDRAVRLGNTITRIATTEVRLLVAGSLQAGDVVLAVRAADPAAWRTAIVERATPRPDEGATEIVLGRFLGPSRPSASGPERLFVLRRRAAVFGHNAPDPRTLSGIRGGLTQSGDDWLEFSLASTLLELDAVYPGLGAGDRVLLRDGDAVRLLTVSAAQQTSVARYALTARITALTVTGDGDDIDDFSRRGTDVAFGPEPLTLLAEPRADAVEDRVVTLATAVPDLQPGRALLFTGPRADRLGTATELATVASLTPDGRTVTLTDPLRHRYRRDGTVIRANVARATHGETVAEILGGGDPSKPLQRFTLKQRPLTFVSAANERGRASTLQIVVDGEIWREVDSFEGAGPTDRVYVVRLGDDGGASVQFGDGVRGARLPSGTANVRATYRRGLGLAGHVRADQLTLLAAPPRGIIGVTNPLPAAGAAPPESLADARRNAPLQVRTIGRVVSVRDYEDFARAFTGVAKAHAVGFRDRDRPGVLVTVAGFAGAQLLPRTPTHEALLLALRNAGAPGVLVRLQPYEATRFAVAGRITAAPDRTLPELRLAVRAALLARFGFDAREFARPVYPSEVVAAIQAVPGVVSVDLTAPTAPLPAFAAARPVDPTDPNARLTELLTLDLDDPNDPHNPLPGLVVTQ